MQTSQEKGRMADRKTSTSQTPLLKVERVFNAPAERVFAAFKSPDAIKAWWWPEEMYTDKVELEFREGGRYFINMKGQEHVGGMTGKFEEIVENKRIVMTDHFADKNGRQITAQEAKMPGDWPEVIYITIDFVPVEESKSRLVLSQDGIPAEVQEDCKAGWNAMFDKLESFLAERKH